MISNPTKEVMDNYINNGMNVLEFADQGYQIMAINTQVEKLSDKVVRQAFCYAINRQGMIDNLLNGYAKLLIALAKGKKEYDKRQTIKEKDIRREMDRSGY